MLAELTIKNAKATDKDYKLSDSEGLYLYVTKFGHRSWRMKYRFAGKERRLVLGSYPEVPLKLARDRKIAARKLLAEGRDPGARSPEGQVHTRAVDRSVSADATATGEFTAQDCLEGARLDHTGLTLADIIWALRSQTQNSSGFLPNPEHRAPG